MNKLTIKEFKDQSNIEIIQELIKINNGYITTKQITELGIHRMYLNIMANRGLIEKIENGIYIDKETFPDSYYILSLNLPGVIYSHMTALYFHDLSIKAPDDEYDLTIKKNYNSTKLKKHNLFYVNEEIYNLGITEVRTPFGNMVKAYDIERCICDIIRSINRMDMEHVKYSIREYLKRKDKNLVNLSIYAKKMGIDKKVFEILGWLDE